LQGIGYVSIVSEDAEILDEELYNTFIKGIIKIASKAVKEAQQNRLSTE